MRDMQLVFMMHPGPAGSLAAAAQDEMRTCVWHSKAPATWQPACRRPQEPAVVEVPRVPLRAADIDHHDSHEWRQLHLGGSARQG